MVQSERDYARIPVKPDTHKEVRAAKRGGETYDELLQRLLRESEAASQPSDSGA